jgi:hypothetical protein
MGLCRMYASLPLTPPLRHAEYLVAKSIPKGETGGKSRAVSSKAPEQAEQAKIFLYPRDAT